MPEGDDDLAWNDGSNDWIGGITDFASDPGQVVRDPYDTLAGAADAGALQFDEGIGGLAQGARGWLSLVDDEPGNVAGPGDSPFLEEPQDADEWDGDGAQPDNPGTTGVPWLDALYKIALIAGAGYALLLLAQIVGPLLGTIENLTEA